MVKFISHLPISGQIVGYSSILQLHGFLSTVYGTIFSTTYDLLAWRQSAHQYYHIHLFGLSKYLPAIVNFVDFHLAAASTSNRGVFISGIVSCCCTRFLSTDISPENIGQMRPSSTSVQTSHKEGRETVQAPEGSRTPAWPSSSSDSANSEWFYLLPLYDPFPGDPALVRHLTGCTSATTSFLLAVSEMHHLLTEAVSEMQIMMKVSETGLFYQNQQSSPFLRHTRNWLPEHN